MQLLRQRPRWPLRIHELTVSVWAHLVSLHGLEFQVRAEKGKMRRLNISLVGALFKLEVLGFLYFFSSSYVEDRLMFFFGLRPVDQLQY